MISAIYTTGYAGHSAPSLVQLLQTTGITVLADVRSNPFSGRQPEMDKPALMQALRCAGMRYVFMGEQLGGRPRNPKLYRAGRIDPQALLAHEGYRAGVARLIAGAASHSICLLCAERDPISCHRGLYIAESLQEAGMQVLHLIPGKPAEDHQATRTRMAELAHMEHADLFASEKDRLSMAIDQMREKIAFTP